MREWRLSTRLLPAVLLLLAGAIAACGGEDASVDGSGPVAMRRLTADQYRRTIADLFGDDIEIVGRFEPDARRDGLLAVGTAWVSITPAGFEQYDAIARHIAAQVVSPERRDGFVPCVPQDATRADAGCSAAFLRSIAPRVLRREVTEQDLGWRVAEANQAADTLGDFYAGLRFALGGLLVSPEFLFRVERGQADSASPADLSLDDATLAARLSYFLWNTTPDDGLLAAAARGELTTEVGFARQLDRLLASPRLADGVRAFFSDVLGFDELEDVSKDPLLFPRFSREVLADAREQTLRTIADQLVSRDGDFRDLFTTRRSFMTRALGVVYRVPVGPRDGWEPFAFASDSPRVGLQSHLSLLALHAHPGRSSATLRGIFVREALLCQEVPAAPADVDFTVVQDIDNPSLKTARERLGAHGSERTCANCHALVDPIGLALENFDGAGNWRAQENGEPIDARGSLVGKSFVGPEGLGQALHESEAVSACAVENLFRYAVGREAEIQERRLLRRLERDFAREGHRFRSLMRAIALSDAFRRATGTREVEPAIAESGASERAREESG